MSVVFPVGFPAGLVAGLLPALLAVLLSVGVHTVAAADAGTTKTQAPASAPSAPSPSPASSGSPAAPAGPGQIHFHLRNGDRLTGIVVAEDASRVILTNAVLGRVVVDAAQIARREPVAPPSAVAVAVAAGGVAGPGAAAAPTNSPPPVLVLNADQKRRLDDLVKVYMADQVSAAEFQRRRMAILEPPRPPGPKRWSGEILSGIDLGFGTKDRQYFSGRLKLNYTDKRLRNALDGMFTYGHTDGLLSANRGDATDKIDYDLDSRYYLYVLGGTGYDEIRRIDYYLQAGPGLGTRILKMTNLVLNAELGANYQLQNFEGGNDTYLFYYRLAQDARWMITPKLILEEKLEYTPQWNEFDQFKLRGEVNLRYWLLDYLSLNLTVIDLYDTRVARGIERNDLQIRSSVGVKF